MWRFRTRRIYLLLMTISHLDAAKIDIYMKKATSLWSQLAEKITAIMETQIYVYPSDRGVINMTIFLKEES